MPRVLGIALVALVLELAHTLCELATQGAVEILAFAGVLASHTLQELPLMIWDLGTLLTGGRSRRGVRAAALLLSWALILQSSLLDLVPLPFLVTLERGPQEHASWAQENCVGSVENGPE